MNIIDYNCFVGGWPFHKVRNKSFSALCELHAENAISGGYVSSTDAIFFNDPYEAELDLAASITNNSYHHVMTVNPSLPGYLNDIRRAVNTFHIEGVRILPGFHGYSLIGDEVSRLCTMLHEYRLPMFLTLRMEDERVTYLFHPKTVQIDEVREFLSTQTGIPILLCNARLNELFHLRDVLLSRQDVYADCCGLKDTSTVMEQLDEQRLTNELVYGSLAPIFCLKSSLLVVQKSDISTEIKDRIFSGSGFSSALKTAFEKEPAFCSLK